MSRKTIRAGLVPIGLALLALAVVPARGAVFIWTNTTSGTASWSASGNWLGGTTPANGGASDATNQFFAETTTALPASAAIAATNDLGSGLPASYMLNVLTLNGLGPAAPGNATVTITGADLVFTNNAGTLPVVSLSGKTNTATLSYQITSNVKLANDTTFRSSGTAPFVFSGVISGSGSLIKTNTSVLTLTGTNTYTGATVIQPAGSGYSVLEANDGVGLPTTSPLQFAGGVLQSIGRTPQTFTRALGTGAGQVQWTTNLSGGLSGGFAANGAKLTVNLGGNASEVTWGISPFSGNGNYGDNLVFGSPTATAEVEFQNNIKLGGGSDYNEKSVYILTGATSGADFATLSGIIRSGTLDVQGPGLLKLTGSNTFTPLNCVGGAVQATLGVGLATNANLGFAGGVFQSSGVYTQSLGTGAGQVQWRFNGGGFAAGGGKLTVNIGGNTNTLVWGSTSYFVADTAHQGNANDTLIFNAVRADSEVVFQNGINLNNATRTIQVNDNAFTNSDFATLPGIISNGGIIKTGGGTLKLTGANTFTGTNYIQQGILEAVDGVGLPSTANLRIGANAGISGIFQSTGTFTRPLGINAGQVAFASNASEGLSAGASKLTVNIGGNATPATLTWGSANFITSGYAMLFGSDTSSAELEFQNPLNLQGTTQTIKVNDNPSTSSDFTTLSGGITNGNLTKTGLGILRLSATNTIMNTIINSGAILVDGLFSTNNSYSVTVNSGGTLGGTGTVLQVINVASNGTIMGGSAGVVGTLTTTNLTLSEGAVVACDIAGGAADLITVNGKLTLPTNAIVQLNYTGSLPASLTLLAATSLAGATNSTVLSGWTLVPPSTRTFRIQGNNVVLSPRRGSVVSLQ